MVPTAAVVEIGVPVNVGLTDKTIDPVPVTADDPSILALHDAAVVPLVKIHTNFANIPAGTVRIAFDPDELTVIDPVELL